MTYLSADQILNADDLKTEDVEVIEWGGTVKVRALSGTERDAYEISNMRERNGKMETNLQNIRAKLCARTIVGEDGQRTFTDQQMNALGNKSAAALQRVFEVAQRLSGLADDSVDEAGKDSEPDQSDGSTSD